MKRVFCILVLVVLFLLGSMVAFADPYAVPGTNSVQIPPVVNTNNPVGQ